MHLYWFCCRCVHGPPPPPPVLLSSTPFSFCRLDGLPLPRFSLLFFFLFLSAPGTQSSSPSLSSLFSLPSLCAYVCVSSYCVSVVSRESVRCMCLVSPLLFLCLQYTHPYPVCNTHTPLRSLQPTRIHCLQYTHPVCNSHTQLRSLQNTNVCVCERCVQLPEPPPG